MTKDKELESLNNLSEWRQGDFTRDCTEFVFHKKQLGTNSNLEGKNHTSRCSQKIVGCVVVSQTCDIVSNSKLKRHVIVCPLIEVDSGKFKETKAGRTPIYGYLPNIGENVVVDFSRFMSIQKEQFASYKRELGWDVDRQLINFSSSLARVFNRYAFPDKFNQIMDNFRIKVYKSHKDPKFSRILESISEFRVYPHSHWYDLESIPISFLAILESDFDAENISSVEIRNSLMTEIDDIKWVKPFEGHIDILDVVEKSSISVDHYEKSYKFDFDFISITN